MKLQELFEGTISFADPDREPGAVDREADARAALNKRELASSDAWESLVSKLKGKMRWHKKPTSGYDSKPGVGADLPGGYGLSMFRSDVMLDIPKSVNKTHREAIKQIWKKHGERLYDTDFRTMDGGSTDSFNALNVGYYSSLDGKDGVNLTKAIIETYKYLKSLETN